MKEPNPVLWDLRPLKLTSSVGHVQEYADCFLGRHMLMSNARVIQGMYRGVSIQAWDSRTGKPIKLVPPEDLEGDG